MVGALVVAVLPAQTPQHVFGQFPLNVSVKCVGMLPVRSKQHMNCKNWSRGDIAPPCPGPPTILSWNVSLQRYADGSPSILSLVKFTPTTEASLRMASGPHSPP